MKKIIRSFGYAFNGLHYAFTTQLNLKVHVAAAVLAMLFGFLLKISAAEWLWVILSITLVLLAELINTAIEALTDLASPEYNEKAGQVKDVSAGAVVVAACFAFFTGILIFLPKILSYLP